MVLLLLVGESALCEWRSPWIPYLTIYRGSMLKQTARRKAESTKQFSKAKVHCQGSRAWSAGSERWNPRRVALGLVLLPSSGLGGA